jgi:hypothetical protein
VATIPRAHQGDDVRILSHCVLFSDDYGYDIWATEPEPDTQMEVCREASLRHRR